MFVFSNPIAYSYLVIVYGSDELIKDALTFILPPGQNDLIEILNTFHEVYQRWKGYGMEENARKQLLKYCQHEKHTFAHKVILDYDFCYAREDPNC